MIDAAKERAKRDRYNTARRAMPKETIPTEEAILRVAEVCAYNDEMDVRRWFERHERMTGRAPDVTKTTLVQLRTFQKVPNEPFRLPFMREFEPLTMGEPDKFGARDCTEFHACFLDELRRVQTLKPTKDSTRRQIGPTDLSAQRVTQWLRDALGITARSGKGGVTLAWLLQYEVAEALCKVLGLTPYQVGV